MMVTKILGGAKLIFHGRYICINGLVKLSAHLTTACTPSETSHCDMHQPHVSLLRPAPASTVAPP
ncbi:hypothetical protein MUK42_36256 [Musa troglodytarum]|uniref:Uncharacterized protein n=1 Tax=Musa troglodytarum TaxID=320322 RepID=A0A9E7EE98_9LILI|nr:hypothetical protein MUK42_36256 [Musa troglodytarum]